jgi:hypothetical protein
MPSSRKYCCQMVKPLSATSGRTAKAMTNKTLARCDIDASSFSPWEASYLARPGFQR